MTNFYDLGVEIKKIPAFLGFIFMNFNEVALREEAKLVDLGEKYIYKFKIFF